MRRNTGTRAAALLLASAFVFGACRTSKPPEENPLLADMVDYRSGLALLREGRVDEAIHLLKRSRMSNPNDPAVPNALGLALLYKREFKMALKSFDESLKLDPRFFEARNNRGVVLLEQGSLDAAETEFRMVVDAGAGSERKNAYFNLGLVHKKRGQTAEAEKLFTLCLTDDGKMLRARRERGLLRMKRDDFDGAGDDLISVLKVEPNDAVAAYNAALCLLASDPPRRDLAAAYMEMAQKASPESDEGQKAKRFLQREAEIGKH